MIELHWGETVDYWEDLPYVGSDGESRVVLKIKAVAVWTDSSMAWMYRSLPWMYLQDIESSQQLELFDEKAWA